ncbi:PAS domain-containing sensor histidine kinase [Labilibaculum sp. DW002]|uniref:histidine kinase n=1 Tax=Paralabilibaculum antarcticum TaxID=2912572 RepID=A0ABT5VWU5_9BACT|nr:PAS domain S-box protein [Labilibaculum sp. DW002]MDE5419791.1 PAS domain-containing sensor histidine kinase [Labilibaculum sp. DW002]
MFQIDFPTVFISYLITNIVSLVVIGLLFLQIKKRFPGTTEILLCFVFNALGTFLIFMRGVFPDWISMTVGNTLIFSSGVMMLIGLQRFYGKRASQLHNYILILVYFLVHFYFAYFDPILFARVLISSFVLFYIFSQSAWFMLRKTPLTMRSMARGVGIIFLIFSLIYVWRIFYLLSEDQFTTYYFNANNSETGFIIANQIVFLFLAYNLTLMFNKRLLTEISTQEELFQGLLKNSFDMIALLDSKGVQHYVSESCEKILGFKAEELINIPVIERLIHPEDQESVLKDFLDMIENKESGGVQYRHRHKNGNWVYLEAFGNNQLDNPAINSVIVNVRDITERKLAEERLKENEIKYKDLVETADIAILIDDEDGYFKFFNDKFCEIFGYTRQEIEQLPIRGLVHPDDVEFVMSHHDNRVKGEKANAKYEFRGVRKNGKTVHLMVSAVSVKSNGEITGSQSYIWDISERKHMEAVLLENKHRNEKAQALGHVGNWEYNLKTNAFWVSDESKRIYGFGLDANNFSAEQVENCIPEREKVHQALIDLINRDKKYDIEFEIIPADKTPRRILHSIAELERDASNNPLRVRGVILDITERKQTEQIIKENEIRLKELNATKDRFFSIIGHDLKSPFNNVIGFSDLIIDQIQEGDYEQVGKYAAIIQDSSERAMNLLNNLLEWSQTQTGRIKFNPEHTDLVGIIDEVLELSNVAVQQKNITIFKDIPKSISLVADQEMINTILRNLITNAIKFTNSGGEVSISTKQSEKELIVSVADNGVGMKKEDIDKLFRIDYCHTEKGTNKEAGTGLGLLLCKEFVEIHKGKIWLESELGKGSVFKFSIPKN